MPVVKMRASADDFENTGQDRGDFLVPPKGMYVLTLKECNSGYSKDDDGKADRKRPRLECVWEITGKGRENEEVTENYGNVWDYVSFNEKSGWKRADFMYALGLVDEKPDDDIEMDVDTDEVVGTQILARLKHEKGRTADDEPRAKIASMFPLSDADGDDAFSAASDEEGSDAGDDPFGSEDEPEEPEADGVDADALREELGELDLKELGAYARDNHEIDPTEHIVKGKSGAKKGKVDVAKTQAALIEAIVTAAAGDEPEADEENPF